MSEIFEFLFSPLEKKWCLYFHYLTIIAFIFLVIALFTAVRELFSKGAKPLALFVTLLAPFIMYFQSRLFYSMCVN